jgi:nicotinate-nucleotide adenylyltransferase
VILVYGGTFDPPHCGHVTLPPQVADHLGAASIIYVPTSANPLKDGQPTAGHHRLAMLELALRDVPDTSCSTIEVSSDGPSYTVDTLQQLRSELGDDTELRLLMGMDAAESFPRWRDPERILELATPAVMARPPWDESALPDERWREWIVPVDEVPVASSEIRRRLHAGEDVTGLIPLAVLDYIAAHQLYTS